MTCIQYVLINIGIALGINIAWIAIARVSGENRLMAGKIAHASLASAWCVLTIIMFVLFSSSYYTTIDTGVNWYRQRMPLFGKALLLNAVGIIAMSVIVCCFTYKIAPNAYKHSKIIIIMAMAAVACIWASSFTVVCEASGLANEANAETAAYVCNSCGWYADKNDMIAHGKETGHTFSINTTSTYKCDQCGETGDYEHMLEHTDEYGHGFSAADE